MRKAKDPGKLSKIKIVPCSGCKKGDIKLRRHAISWLGSCSVCSKFVGMLIR